MIDREAIARTEVGHTTVSVRLARTLAGWFVLMLVLFPLVEIVARITAGAPSAWSHLAGVPGAIGERLAAVRADARDSSRWHELMVSNRAVLEGLSAFETALEDQSAVGRALRPHMQQLLSGALGAGNERVYVGHDGWLFYRPDVEYVTSRGFLHERVMARRVAAAREYEAVPQPDPRPAIRQFKRDLEARGITLVIMPTPVKPTIHPGQLYAPAAAPLHNESYGRFVDDLQGEGVLVFDPSPTLAHAAAAGGPQFLATDTHWRPESMQHVALTLAEFLQQHVHLPAVDARYTAEPREARQLGDTAMMLDLPRDQTLYLPEPVRLNFIVDAGGEPWRASRDADILLLGDSFTNMFSLATMGWGEAAGFAEQLSYTLQRPVDRLVQNDQGAHATRELLRREVGGANDRLEGKRVVIWQFAARELAFGDWKVIEIRAPQEP